MKRFKVVGLCLVAVFALCAVLVASASAASPEYFTCTKAPVKNTGNYSGKACSEAEKVAGTGKYERTAWNAGKKTSFKGKNEGNPHNNIVNPFGKNKVVGEPGQIEGTTTCEKEKVAGNVTGPKETKWKTEYKKCSALETKCNTAGQKEGTIVTEELESTLVWLDSGKTKAGIKVKGLGPGGRLAQYECLNKGLQVNVFGEILAEVQGATGAASKSQKDVAAEGPLHLQGVGGTYVEEAPFGANSEQAAKGWWEYDEGLKACEAGKEPFPPGPHSTAECEGFLGGPNPVPVKPTLLESIVTGVKEGDAPGIQNGTSNVKGEAIGIA
jgi:hypothetical protein